MFNFVSLTSCANAIKYLIASNDFDVDSDYIINNFDPLFYLSSSYCNTKVEGYNSQDKLSHRPIDNNVNLREYNYFS